ncbi:MAG TPA: NAD-dependent epimerase/dehydratase family protein [Telluria sp.]|jgi:nucleoside-diphosphate-sugar epimerase
MKFIVGARGRLGQALARRFGPQAQCLARAQYEHWPALDADAARAEIAACFSAHAHSGATIFVTAGLLDPTLAPEQHARVNVELPRRIIDAVAPLGIRVVTFGTVMETLLARQNPYVRSKSELAAFVAAQVDAGADLCHVRVHTLYGEGQPSPFMFLGLILAALRSGTEFKMTSGKQLREYHHVDDEAAAVALLEAAAVRGVLDLSSGTPLSLRALATGVFAAFGADASLKLGALPEPLDENYSTVFAPHALLVQAAFRPALPAIIDYLQKCAAQQELSE